jgi:hypothetical protein
MGLWGKKLFVHTLPRAVRPLLDAADDQTVFDHCINQRETILMGLLYKEKMGQQLLIENIC